MPAVPAGPPDLERRISLVLVAACVVLAALLLVVFPPFYETYDDAKYIGLGLNLLEGNGPYTDFGRLFVNHSPVWPLLIAAPQHWFGIPAVSVGHFLNAISLLSTIGLTAALAWRYRPYAGALAAIALLGFPYVHNLARTAGLDLPAIALTLGYLLVGSLAFRRGAVRMAIAAGALFALAFLMKETVLPFAPVPIAVGIMAARPWREIARQAAWLVLVATIGLAWWFAMHAYYAGVVYRLGTPAWTLGPLAVAVVVFVAGGLLADRLAAALDARGIPARVRALVPAAVALRSRGLAAGVLLVGWAGALGVLFSRAAKLGGQPLLRGEAFTAYVADWDQTLALITAFSLTGALLAGVYRLGGRGDAPGRPAFETAYAIACGIPLLLLVIAIGETPRHYVAWLAVVVALAAMGWVAVVARIVERRDRVALGAAGAALALGLVVAWPSVRAVVSVNRALAALAALALAVAVVGLVLWRLAPARRAALLGRTRDLALPVLLVASLVVNGAILVSRSSAVNDLDPAREQAVEATAAWVHANVPAGSWIALSQFLSTDLALALRDDYQLVEIRAGAAIADPTAPLALRWPKLPPTDEWIAADTALRNATQYSAHSPGTLLGPFAAKQATWFVFPTISADGTSPFLPPLQPNQGFTEVDHAVYPVGDRSQIDVHVFSVDLERLGWDRTKLYLSPAALEQMLPVLEADPDAAQATAGRILDRLVLVPDDPATSDPLVARLRAVAGR